MSDWIKVLSQFDEEQIPEGWATTSQISEELKLPMETIYKRLKRRLAHGEVERKSFLMKGRKVNIWKPKKLK